MTSPVQSLEEAFQYNCSLARTYLTSFTAVERPPVEQWLERLSAAGLGLGGGRRVDALRTRNDYMWFLLLVLRNGRISEPFRSPPPPGALPPLYEVLPDNVYEEVLGAAGSMGSDTGLGSGRLTAAGARAVAGAPNASGAVAFAAAYAPGASRPLSAAGSGKSSGVGGGTGSGVGLGVGLGGVTTVGAALTTITTPHLRSQIPFKSKGVASSGASGTSAAIPSPVGPRVTEHEADGGGASGGGRRYETVSPCQFLSTRPTPRAGGVRLYMAAFSAQD